MIFFFKIKSGYRLKLLTPETMKLLGKKLSTKIKMERKVYITLISFWSITDLSILAISLRKVFHALEKLPSQHKTSSRHLRVVLELSCLDKTFLNYLQGVFM